MPLAWRAGDETSGYENKHILRTLAREILPKSVVDLPKVGMTRPVCAWFDPSRKLGQLADQYLLKKGGAFEALFDLSEVARHLEEVRAGNTAAVRRVIHLLHLGKWIDANT